MGTRGVLYITWGDEVEQFKRRSIASLRKFHPDLPVHEVSLPDGATLLDKSQMFDLSPFGTTLYLDADTVVLGDLTAGFEAAEQHGIACCINECPLARRYPSMSGDDIEYNTGVLFFSKRYAEHMEEDPQVAEVFHFWKANRDIDSSIRFQRDGQILTMPANDQAGFAKAIKDTGFNPFILPMNWNFRQQWHKTWFGNIKIWHDYADVPEPVLKFNERHPDTERVIGFAMAIPQKKVNLPPTVAVMSMGRYALAQNMLCSHKALFPLDIPLEIGFGVYYHKILSDKLKHWSEQGAKYILCIDYDSKYTSRHVLSLISLAEQHPEADAICATQIKRGEKCILGTIERDGKAVAGEIQCDGDLTPIATGHFGLTLLRVESLKKLPKPWMHFAPDENGEWGGNCVDADVWFWRQMQKAGQKAFMAHGVAIGHIQEMVAVPDGHGGVTYATVNEAMDWDAA